MSGIQVACAAEGSYVPHSAAMLHSVLVASSSTVTIHYLHGPDLTEFQRRQLTEMVEPLGGRLRFVYCDDEDLADLPTTGFTKKATWYRIFLPELLEDLDRILYLDADLIVVNDLSDLWEIDLDDNYVGAVTNVLEPHYARRLDQAGLRPRDYFNAGVMLLNLDRMRMDRCSDRLYEYGVEHRSELVLRDQDALNAVLGSRRLRLHPRWNCMNAFFVFPWSEEVLDRKDLVEARRHPAVRHFEGPDINKPWHYLCEHSSRELYLEHRRETPWPKFRLEGSNPRNAARRLARRFREKRSGSEARNSVSA